MTEFKNKKPEFSWRKALLAVAIIAVISALLFVIFKKESISFETEKVSRTNVTEIISGTGTVDASQEAQLSFEVSGLISQILVTDGDFVQAGMVLARLNSSELDSQIDEALSNLRSEVARRDASFGDDIDSNKLQNTRETLVSILNKAYVTADDVVRNAIDPFFENPNVRYSNFDFALVDYFRRKSIEEQRYEISFILEKWQSDIEKLKSTNVTVAQAQEYLTYLRPIENLLSTIATGVGDFMPHSGKSQAQIDSYLNGISQARIRTASLLIEINNSLESLRQVQSQSPVFDATIEGLSSSVQRLQTRKDSYEIKAPFDGIVNTVFANRGESVTPGNRILSLISAGEKSVTLFVSETDIANLEVGDLAQISFSAFPDEYFDASVGYVSPAAQNRDGVTVFKTELYFNELDSRIRVGMSAEVDIYTTKRENVLSIPGRSIIRSEGKTYVRLVVDGEIVEQEVIPGLRGHDGRVEIQSGLSENDEVITFYNR